MSIKSFFNSLSSSNDPEDFPFELTSSVFQIEYDKAFELIRHLIEFANLNQEQVKLTTHQDDNEQSISIVTSAFHSSADRVIENHHIAVLTRFENTEMHGTKSTVLDVEGDCKVKFDPAALYELGNRYSII
mgnify:CR=1 FL=1